MNTNLTSPILIEEKDQHSVLKQIKEAILFSTRHNKLLYDKIKWLRYAEQLSEDEINEINLKKAVSIIKYAIHYSPYYKNLYSSVDLSMIAREGLSSLPVLTKKDIRNNTKDLATVPLSLLKAAHTSGTTGTPLTIYRSLGSILRENAYVWHYRSAHGLEIGAPVISLRGTLDRHTTHYFNKSENILYLSSYNISSSTIAIYERLIRQMNPTALLAYPGTAYHLVNSLTEAGLKVNIPLIFTSSETLYDFQREKIEKSLGGKIFDLYGNAERTIALGQCAYGNYHDMPLYSINQFGKEGVYTTSLTNQSFPLINYYVDDRFTLGSGTCNCGRKLQVRKIDGRGEDIISCPNGVKVTGAALSLSFRGINGIQASQIHQDDISKIKINVVTDSSFTAAEENKLLKQLNLRLNNSLTMEINEVSADDIIYTASGKFKLIHSTVTNS